MLVALSPEKPWEFLAAMSQAWEWTQARPWAYCDTGGKQTIEDYLTAAKSPDQKQIAVLDTGMLVSVVTVRLLVEGVFEIHVTSPPKTRARTLADALQAIARSLFETMDARVIVTSCPTYGRHEHKGSRRLAETCGMRRNGVMWHSNGALWREYELTRETYYGQSKASTNERLPIQTETVLGGTGSAASVESAG